eukprot:COSAG01_NODE_430_length_17153_cov_24.866717_11_plen_76_part_00
MTVIGAAVEFCAAFVANDAGMHSSASPVEPEPESTSKGSSGSDPLRRQLSHSVVQAVAATIYAHRSILRKVGSAI